MPRASGLAAAITLLAVASASLPSAPAAAEETSDGREKAMCASKYQSAQRLRAGGKLTLARADLLRCAEPACPAFVSKDCKTWLAEVEADLPTLVFAVLDANGGDVPGATVRLDGIEVPHATDGLGHALDPGTHVVEASEGGQSVRAQVIARVGEKSRRVPLRLGIGSSSPASSPAMDGETRSTEGGPPAGVYVLGGVGVLAIVAGTVLWVTGSNAAKNYNDDCATIGCTASRRDDVQRQLLAGDIAWGIGIAAALGAGAIVLFQGSGGGSGGGAPTVSLGPTGLRLQGTF